MCSCEAHVRLVDCTCSCDHTGDRMLQYRKRVQQLECVAMRTNFDDVGQFHEKFALDNVTFRGPGARLWNSDLINFRIKFMTEELDEFKKGYEAEDHAQMADALVDLVYVAMGTAQLMGYPWHSLWDAVQDANMCKKRAVSADQSKRGSTFDVIKPEGWQPPPIQEILESYGW